MRTSSTLRRVLVFASIPKPGLVLHCGVRHFLHAGGYEHLVQPAAQCSLCFPGDAAERQLHSRGRHRRFSLQLRRLRCWDTTDRQLRRVRSYAPSQYIQQWSVSVEKSLGQRHDAGGRVSGFARSASAARAPDQQRAAGARRHRAAPSVHDASALCRTPFCRTLLHRTSRLSQRHDLFPVSTINLLENTAQSWYDAGYVNVRRRYSHGLTFLANYTLPRT